MNGFDWDSGNKTKNWLKHKVTKKECESVFLISKPIIAKDPKHSSHETRYSAINKTKKGRLLTLFFTIRNNKIRIISARDSSKNEKAKYEQKK